MRQIKSKSTGGAREGAGRPPGRANVATQNMKATLSELAREHTGEALQTVLEVMREGATDAIRLAAAVHVLDRGYGRPQAAVAVSASRESEGLQPEPVAAAVLRALERIHSDD
jgi:hypothetical protein